MTATIPFRRNQVPDRAHDVVSDHGGRGPRRPLPATALCPRCVRSFVTGIKALTDRGVTLVSTTDGIDSSTASGRMVIGVLASMAEFERELVKERTALQRETSRANGTKFGRPRKVDDAEHIATAKRMKADGHTAKDIAKYLGVSRATLYRYLTDGAA
jgi:DNA invertase Pin-like site-specific DNA recombinase